MSDISCFKIKITLKYIIYGCSWFLPRWTFGFLSLNPSQDIKWVWIRIQLSPTQAQKLWLKAGWAWAGSAHKNSFFSHHSKKRLKHWIIVVDLLVVIFMVEQCPRNRDVHGPGWTEAFETLAGPFGSGFSITFFLYIFSILFWTNSYLTKSKIYFGMDRASDFFSPRPAHLLIGPQAGLPSP